MSDITAPQLSRTTIGLHEVHYVMVVILSIGIGLFAPPFGVGFHAACAIGRVPPDAATGRVWPYLGALFLALIIVALVPRGRFDSE